ncbi:hypothetical protein [Streptomyces sp. NPDC093591]|uniref:hypothetical protein n=1 Tax=Streptomyces sp. NPDC093591 TaxID=3366044 RepID=UPI0037F92666
MTWGFVWERVTRIEMPSFATDAATQDERQRSPWAARTVGLNTTLTVEVPGPTV